MKAVIFRLTIIFSLLAWLSFSSISIGLSEGYNEPTSTISPHGGYATTTNKCKYCHAVHLAEGSYMLTRANTVFESCDYCHGDGSGAGTIIVTNFEGHTTGKNAIYLGEAPGGIDGHKWYSSTSNPLTCLTCHSVHGNISRVVVLSDLDKNYLLVNNPDGTGTPFNSSNTLSEWCADCHPLMFGSNEQPKLINNEPIFSHSSSRTVVTTPIIDADDGRNYGPSCKQCHSSSLFPHGQGGTGRDMLKDSFDGISLDNVCNDCHNEDDLP